MLVDFEKKQIELDDKKLDKIIENQEQIKKGLNQLIKIMKNNNKTEVVVEQEEEKEVYDEFLKDAIEFIVDLGQASTSYIQRKFKLGYARAGRIIDQMQELGIITGYKGSKPREVLYTKEKWEIAKEDILKKIDENT